MRGGTSFPVSLAPSKKYRSARIDKLTGPWDKDQGKINQQRHEKNPRDPKKLPFTGKVQETSCLPRRSYKH